MSEGSQRLASFILGRSEYAIPLSVIVVTLGHINRHGSEGLECMVFWAGKALGLGKFEVTDCIHPHHHATSLSVDIEPDESSRIQRMLFQHKQILLAQVHSHPSAAFHSSRDDSLSMSHKPGFISIVVPSFGRIRLSDLSECKVYEHIGYGRWRNLTPKEVAGRFVIVD